MICEKVKLCVSNTVNLDNSCLLCRKESNNRIIKLSERKVKYYLKNDSGYNVILFHVDGGIIRDLNAKKCDYLACVFDTKESIGIFIELKGSDIKHGLEQIKETLDLIVPQLENYKIKARVVYDKAPAYELTSKASSRILKEIKKKYGDVFEFRRSGTAESI